MMSDEGDRRTRTVRFTKPGSIISHYRVIRSLGAGGMGEVYLAEDVELDRKVALKFLSQRFASDTAFKTRFKREAKALARLNHPNVAAIYEVSEYRQLPFFVMEYVDGLSLESLLEHRALTVEEMIDIITQVCEGLDEVHNAGIVHRDIKPANIIVGANGKSKLVDFGISTVKGTARVTRSGFIVGTPNYMSPEQVQGIEADRRSDLFSLGIVVYEMITGENPFECENETETLEAILHKEPEPLTDRKGIIPETVDHIVSRMLAKRTESRYQSATDLLTDLSALRDGKLHHENITTVWQNSHLAGDRQAKASIAVLSMIDLSPEKNQEYFCDGVAEEIINALAMLNNIKVVSRSSSFQFKGQNCDSRDIGKRLGVNSVLEGSVRKAGERIRITVQLVDVKDGFYVWSEKYDSKLSDIFTIQEEISKVIVEKLKVDPEKRRDRPLVNTQTENVEAYNDYLRGRYHWYRRYEGGLQKSVEYFQNAIKHDPLYASAYAGMADSFNIIGFYNFMAPHEACTRAKAAAARALELAPDLAEAHTSMGWVYAFYDWDWTEAEHEFTRAIDLNDRYAVAHHYYALFLLAMQRFEEGFREMNKALDLDPLATIISTSLGASYYFSRQHDRAIDQYLKALEFDPDFAIAHAFLAGPYVCHRNFEAAARECRTACQLAGGSNYPYAFLAYINGMSGNIDEADAILQNMLKKSETEYISAYHIALIYCGMGEREKSLDWLEKAYEERDNWLIWLNVYPVFDPIRESPRFKSLLKKVGLEYQDT